MKKRLRAFLKKILPSRANLIRYWFNINHVVPLRYLHAWFFRPRLAWHWLVNKLCRCTVVCHPHQPAEVGYEICKLAMVLGFRIRPYYPSAKYAMAWQDITVRTFSLPERPAHFLNGNCMNIGKDRVAEVFAAVFGYPLRIDPTTHRGLAVCKGLINGKHDGRVIECPIEQPETGRVYERLIDNRVNDSQILDLRTTVYRDQIPIVYKKIRPLATRFGNLNARASIARAEEIYSAEEREKIIAFCRAFGVDYVGLDVLRDAADGRIYIVDANTTSFGPPVELLARDRAVALGRLGVAFQKNFLCASSPSVRAPAAPSPVKS